MCKDRRCKAADVKYQPTAKEELTGPRVHVGYHMGKREESKAFQRAQQITQKEAKNIIIISPKCWKIVKQKRK